ncbi:MAG: hypothetical protein A2X86_21400 [Bdellovibrionales bacterium GWA2_49_15]|nr:MAG: hypothetical protein A2X86_21400 [Bdellovibrionales bacterium GWA2_49_15]HAZ14936.1 hypothetical protein [Bdellovibrionales bacterium]
MIKLFRSHILLIMIALTGCTDSDVMSPPNIDSPETPAIENSTPIGSNVGVATSDPIGVGIEPNSEGSGSSDPAQDGIAPFKFWTNQNNQSFVQFQCQDGISTPSMCGQVKEIGFCLNCIGAKSPEMTDLFNNIGEAIMSCPEYEFPEDFSGRLFFGGELIPIAAVSQYNPNKLQDAALSAKFTGLCPYASEEPIVLGLVDRQTRVVTRVPLVLCGSKIYPLTGATISCEESAKEVMGHVEKAIGEKNSLQEKYSKALEEPQFIDVDYNVVALSDFLEGQYIRCGKDSEAICQKMCSSKLSCILPLNMEKNLKSILSFETSKLKICEGREIKFETLLTLIQGDNTFVFSHRSLNMQYEGVPNSGDFHDFSDINGILNDFRGIFQTDRDWKEDEYRTFLFSPAYRNKVKAKLDAFCRPSETTYIMGRDGRGELALCQSDSDLRVLVLAFNGEDCQFAGNQLAATGPIIERAGN